MVARYGRHSKSIDLERSRCGRCSAYVSFIANKAGLSLLSSQLILPTRLKKDGTPYKPRGTNGFQVYMQTNFRQIRAENPGVEHRELMALTSRLYKASYASSSQEGTRFSVDDGQELDYTEEVVEPLSSETIVLD